MRFDCMRIFLFLFCFALVNVLPVAGRAQMPEDAQAVPTAESAVVAGQDAAVVQDSGENSQRVSSPSPQQTTPTNSGQPVSEGFPAAAYNSLVFTYWEHNALRDARNSRGMVRAPTEGELMRDLNTRDLDFKEKPPPEERDISLSGIVYHGKGDWTIWLNGQRISPSALPKEAIDLQVFKDYIEVKWFDEYTNQIFPICLRPHQRFNMDTRMFLPG